MKIWYHPSEIENKEWVSIPSKKLYSLWDSGYELIIEGNKGISRKVLTKDYTGFTCSDDYQVAKFKATDKKNTLDEYHLKLLFDYQVHPDFFNPLFDVWKSEEFILSLKQANELRASDNSLPLKENQFNFLKNRPDQCIFPPENYMKGVFKDFINKCKKVQDEFSRLLGTRG